MELTASGQAFAWPFPLIMARLLSGRFAAAAWFLSCYHEEKAT
jgi:hypothetical protein